MRFTDHEYFSIERFSVAVTFHIFIRKVMCSKLGQNTEHPDRLVFLCFFSVPPGK
jgi:hypothetical protein